MLQLKIVKKAYGDQTILENIDLNISKNGIYGLIGKNGGGKTTFFRCLLSLTAFDGTVLLQGNTPKFSEMAWCPTEPTIYDELTAVEFAKFYSELLKIKYDPEKVLFDLPNGRLIKEFSTGMKKKAYFNAVLQKKYTVYIFDEPFNGLDLESNYHLINYIREVAKEAIVFISSHILEILYKDCDSIFLIQHKTIRTFEKEQFPDIEKTLFTH